MFSKKMLSRRSFMILAGSAGAGVLAGCSKAGRPKGEEGTAIEILARQHGVLYRSVAILEAVKGELDAWMDVPSEIVAGTVQILRLLLVNHHQPMEEKHIYPVFNASTSMSGLLGVLRDQHAAGARLIDILEGLCKEFSVKDLEKRRRMSNDLHLFSRMYRAHAEREDTELFPFVRRMVTPKSYAELSSVFRKAEDEFLGKNGFEQTIRNLEGFENALGIGDLASFTPRAEQLK